MLKKKIREIRNYVMEVAGLAGLRVVPITIISFSRFRLQIQHFFLSDSLFFLSHHRLCVERINILYKWNFNTQMNNLIWKKKREGEIRKGREYD
jgi:hypothetical protein